MLERLLEQVLLKTANQYIEGINKENLKVGAWNGKVEISHVKVRSSVFEKLGLPLKVQYSYIEQLNLKIPWQNLGSAPVNVNLENVFLVVSLIDGSEWKPQDFESVASRMNFVDALIRDYQNKLKEARERASNQRESSGYMSKLTEKIIDNLQVPRFSTKPLTNVR